MEAFGLVMCIFALPVFILFILIDLYWGIRYKKSSKYKGKVIDSLNTEIVRLEGYRGYGEIYETYDVWYDYKGEILRGEVCTSQKGLKPGASIDVYVYDKDGNHEIQSDISWRRLETEMQFGVMLLIIVITIAALILLGEHLSAINGL